VAVLRRPPAALLLLPSARPGLPSLSLCLSQLPRLIQLPYSRWQPPCSDRPHLPNPPTPQFLRQLLAPERQNTCIAAARRVSPELKQLQQQYPDRLVITNVDVSDEASVTSWAKGLADKVSKPVFLSRGGFSWGFSGGLRLVGRVGSSGRRSGRHTRTSTCLNPIPPRAPSWMWSSTTPVSTGPPGERLVHAVFLGAVSLVSNNRRMRKPAPAPAVPADLLNAHPATQNRPQAIAGHSRQGSDARGFHHQHLGPPDGGAAAAAARAAEEAVGGGQRHVQGAGLSLWVAVDEFLWMLAWVFVVIVLV
jgi:hypothetical protein